MSQAKTKKAPLTLRAMILFLAFALCGVVLYYVGMHYHKNVAASETGSLDTLIYEDDVFLLAGKWGDKGLGTVPFQYADKALGEVKPEGKTAWTHTFMVYGMDPDNKSFPVDKKRDDYLVVIHEDGEAYVYHRISVPNPAEETKAPDTAEDEPAEE